MEKEMLVEVLCYMAKKQDFFACRDSTPEDVLDSSWDEMRRWRNIAKEAKAPYGLTWKSSKLAARMYRKALRTALSEKESYELCKRIVDYAANHLENPSDSLDALREKVKAKFLLKQAMMRKYYEFKMAEIEYNNLYERYMREFCA